MLSLIVLTSVNSCECVGIGASRWDWHLGINPDCLKGGGSADRTRSGHLGALFPLRRWCLWAAFWQRSRLRCLRVIMANIVAGKQENNEDVCVWLISHLLPLPSPPCVCLITLKHSGRTRSRLSFFHFLLNFFSLLYFPSVTNALVLSTWLEDPSIFCLPLPRYFSHPSFHHPDSSHPLSIIAFSPQVVFIERLRMHRLLPSTGPMQVFPPWLSLCTLSSPTTPPPPYPSPPCRRPAVSFFWGPCVHTSHLLPVVLLPLPPRHAFSPARACSLLIASLPPRTPALCDSLQQPSACHCRLFCHEFWIDPFLFVSWKVTKSDRGRDASFVGLKAVLFINRLLKPETGFVQSWNCESWRNCEHLLQDLNN